MNAKWLRSLCVAAGALWLSASLISTTYSAQPTDGDTAAPGAKATAEKSLSSADVDKILSDARAAIANGNLDQAEALVSRAEKTHTRYPLFHFGPTPSSVRQELTDAEAKRGLHGEQAAAAPNAKKHDASHAAGDPFAQRPMPLPSASQPASQQMPIGMNGDPRHTAASAGYDRLPGDRESGIMPASATAPLQDRAWDAPEAPLPPGLKSETPAAAHDLGPNQTINNQFAVDDPSTLAHKTLTDKKAQTLELLRQARQALAAGNLDGAQAAAQHAGALGVPESLFLPNEDKPSVLAWDIQQAAGQRAQGPKLEDAAAAPAVAEVTDPNDRYIKQTRVSPERDTTRNVRATTAPPGASSMRFAELPEPLELPSDEAQPPEESLPQPGAKSLLPSPGAPPAHDVSHATTTDAIPMPTKRAEAAPKKSTDATANAAQLLEAGEAALKQRDKQLASTLFGQAYVLRDQLDSAQQQRLQEHLQMLTGGDSPSAPDQTKAMAPASLMDSTAESQQVLARQMSAEIGKKQSEARHIREKDPRQALKILKDARQQVVDSKLSEEYRTQLLHRIDLTLDETEKYVNDHRSEIELDEKNKAVLDEVQRDKEVKLQVQQKIADLVDQFNKLRDEQRFAEMEVVARRLNELAPEDPVAQQVWQTAKFIRREYMNRDLIDRKEESVWATLNDVENSAIQTVGDQHEMIYDQKHWDELKSRKGSGERNERRTERELEIERRLKTPVLLKYENTPLSEVMHGMSELAGVNIHLDPRGLNQEGVNSDTPVTINLSKEISLKSALNLILEPLHLSYVVKDEVLKITSEQLRDGEVYSKVYNVADLVIPIPNFVPNNNIGLQGLINDAHASMGYGQGGIGTPGPTVLVNNDRAHGGQQAGDSGILAQHLGSSTTTPTGAPSPALPIGSGPGGMGAGANADFDSLIDLITSTVASESWAENGGGQAEIRPFPTNLSLVISQTQAVHEQIADLLEQLRRLQDLQVTIEVRFIRLNDSFFERIGVDFQANIQSRTTNLNLTPGANPPVNGLNGQKAQSSIVGLNPPVQGSTTASFPNFTSDLDIPFVQHSFDLTSPAFGSPQQVSEFGFAILSDIQAYFLIEAAQGDARTNVLNAPKVTLYNGQQAFVADATSQPFVIGVIPVVGEFAAAQQPVIVVLNEGTMMSIQAVVSDDRRYVRLTVVPFFTQIGDVKEFTFEGTTSSTSSSSTTDNNSDGKNESTANSDQASHQGVTVQLPSFSFVAVVTTVSVPDGGTVLLGGIKRLSEGRKEIGVPLLSKVPYINRLFKNVGIGRETDSLMMMVTPRIIIQEEEEERLGVAQTGH